LRFAVGDQAMPWKIENQGDKYVVVKEGTGEVVKAHATRELAEAHLKALYAAEPEAGKSAPEAVKVGARNNSGDAGRLREMLKLAKRMQELCRENGATDDDSEEEEKEHMPGESVNPIPGAIDGAGSKAATLPMFNYVSKLHLPHDEQYFREVLAVKSVDGKDCIRGYTMLWGNPELVDVETEFFTPQTNFWDKQLEGMARPLTYDHAQEKSTAKDPVIGKIVEFGDDEIGRWYVAQLSRNHRYRQAVDQLIRDGATGTSSDSASQYVIRKSAGKAVWLAQWPWFASALTPTPAEPRMLDVGLPFWKAAGVDFARMGAPEGATAQSRLKLPDNLRRQAELLKIKVGVK
jgi:hypothetical protein